jgi:hypothetical protein
MAAPRAIASEEESPDAGRSVVIGGPLVVVVDIPL